MDKLRAWALIPVLVFCLVSFGLLTSCKQPPRQEVVEEEAPESIPGSRRVVAADSKGKVYVPGINPLERVSAAIASLEALSPPGVREAVEIPAELSATVGELIDDEEVPLDNKIYLLTVYQEKAKWLPPDYLETVAQKAGGSDLSAELNYSVAQLIRNELRVIPSRVEARELEPEKAESLLQEFGELVVNFFAAAYEKRDIEPLIIFGLIGAYYDRAWAHAGGKAPKDEVLLRSLNRESMDELLGRLDQGEFARGLAGPPWVFYRIDWSRVPPDAVGRELIWGSWSTSAGQMLLVMMRETLREKQWRESFQMLQRLRTVIAVPPVTIESIEYMDEVTDALVESLVNAPLSSEDRKTARSMQADFKEFNAQWIKERREAREQSNRQLAEGDAEEALKTIDLYARMAVPAYFSIVDRVEDVLRKYSAEEARREREAQGRTPTPASRRREVASGGEGAGG